jgi:uncharacterized protein involved in exopolysaccharide biosynthesis/Mrp family chromosome partitioning ATPase
MEQRQFFVRDVLTVLFKRWKLIIFLPIVIFALVFAGNYLWPPTYESVSKVRLVRGREVSQTDSTVMPGGQEFTMVSLTVEDLNSEIELIQSKDLLEAVVRDLDLANNPDFPYGRSPIRAPYQAVRAVMVNLLDMAGIHRRPGPEEQAQERLRHALSAKPIRDSFVLEVSCRLGDPALARQVLTKVMDEFQALHLRVFATPQSSEFFKQKRQEVLEQLQAAENKLLEARNRNNVGAIEAQIEDLNRQYADLERMLQQLREWERTLSGDVADADPVAILAIETDSTVVREMQLRLYELVLERNRVRQSLGASHPQVQSTNAQVMDAFNGLKAAIQRTKANSEQKLTHVTARLQELNTIKSEFDSVQRDVDILSDTYALYARQLEQAIITEQLAEMNVSSLRMVSAASLATNPVRPNRLLNLAVALIGGLVLALALAFLFEYLDHGLKTPEDVEYYVKLTPLASFFNRAGQPLDARDGERLAAMADTLCGDAGSQVYEVTSAVSNEGSAQVADALARGFARDAGSRTLLVDFAGAAPRGQAGLADVLLDQASLDEIAGGDGNLAVIGRGGGDVPANIWGSERMRALVEELRARYKYIVFHTGPVLQSQDAPKIARFANGVLLAIKADATRREVVMRAVDLLEDANAKVMGAVLTERRQTIPRSVYRRFLRA